MTNTNSDDRNSSPSRNLGFDEFIAIFVAFTTIGAIMWWSLSRQTTGWQFSKLPSTTPTPSVSPTSSISDLQGSLFPTPAPTATPTPITGGEKDKDSTGIGGIAGTAGIAGIAGGVSSIIGSQNGNVPPQDTSPSTSSPVGPSAVVPVPSPTSPGETPDSTATTPASPETTPSNQKSIIPPPIVFPDTENFWGKRFIDVLSKRENRLIEGFSDYTFRPNEPINRAQFAAMLQKAIDKPVPEKALNFKDVAEDFWGKKAIQKGIDTGFLKGYPDQNFKPDQRIPRVQVLVALASGLNLPIPDNPEKVISIYKDAKDIPNYAIGKVAAATMNQLVVVESPEQQLLLPNKEATRGEAAVMIYQTLVRMNKLDAIKSPNIVRPKSES
ncbi:MAG: S-layer homology domain-containing protein [Calothrix sp. MO_192.B10]|nr:S-layer homology domain-containing protein [Calothrix sp. MO_192.B10]